jgi:hypothetical protein
MPATARPYLLGVLAALSDGTGDGGRLARAADLAYTRGVVQVAVVSIAVLAVGAVLVLLFLPGSRRRGAGRSGTASSPAELRPAGLPRR